MSRVETYPGIASFQDTPEDRVLFRGRDRESDILANLVLGDRLTVLCSRSGLGKTSLINAGLLHRIRERQYMPIVARLIDPVSDPVASIIGYIRSEAAKTGGTISDAAPTTSLWSFLNASVLTRGGGPVKLLLILDQFEELFTRVREHDRDRGTNAADTLIRDLSDIVRRRLPDDVREQATKELDQIDAATMRDAARDRDDVDLVDDSIDPERRHKLVKLLYDTSFADVKILLSLREDYLADLDRMRVSVPSIFRNMLRLEPLSIEAAKTAITEPAAVVLEGKDTFTYEPAALELIIDFLRKRWVEKEQRWIVENHIDPWQLQILCQSLDRKRQAKKAEYDKITKDEVGDTKMLDRILTGFYLDILREVPLLRLGPSSRRLRLGRGNGVLVHSPRVAARALIEHGLITRDGKRNSMSAVTVSDDYGIAGDDLCLLKAEKLVRTTSRDDVEMIEITHDSLIRSIGAYLKERKRRRYTAIATIAVAMALSVAAVTLKKTSDLKKRNLNLEQKNQQVTRQIDRLQHETRVENISLLMQKLDLAGAALTDAPLSNARIENTVLDKSRLIRAVLRNAEVSNSTFIEADLSGADLTDAKFIDSVLSSSNFAGADLTNTQFRDTLVDGATMRGVKAEGATFEGTAWWLASGWSEAQRTTLAKAFPTAKIGATAVYVADVREQKKRLSRAASADERVATRLSLARYMAVRGTDLREALQYADQAVRLSKRNARAHNMRGFILYMLGEPAAARTALETARTLAPDDAEIAYHLSLVYQQLGDADKATIYRSQSERGSYRPSYELVLEPQPQVVTPALLTSDTPGTVASAPITTMAQLEERIIDLISEFENGRPSWGLAFGNFDGAGLTFGVVGFTLQQGGLQKVLRDMRATNPSKFDEIMGDGRNDILRVIDVPIAEAMTFADSISVSRDKAKLQAPWTQRFEKLGAEPEFRAVQMDHVRSLYLAPALRNMADQKLRSRLGFALMADIQLQNGGIKPAAAKQMGDRVREAEEKAGEPLSESARMLIIANAVADHSNERFREYVRARKLAIANGGGMVYGRLFEMKQRGITLDPLSTLTSDTAN
jgi:uncharacterized protein YjbI with pentapeptide repeats